MHSKKGRTVFSFLGDKLTTLPVQGTSEVSTRAYPYRLRTLENHNDLKAFLEDINRKQSTLGFAPARAARDKCKLLLYEL